LIVAAAPASAQPITLVDRAADDGLGAVTAPGSAWAGAGIAFVDLDGDRWPDLYFGGAKGGPDWLCLNRHGHFDCQPVPGTMNQQDVVAIAAGDVDADGDLDLYVMRQGPNSLLINDGYARFTDVTDARHAGTDTSHPITSTGTFLDYDGDGRLDLLLGHWESFGTSIPQAHAQLLRQREDGTFTDVTLASGIDNRNHPSLALIAADWDKDGKQDVWITGDFHPTYFFHNSGDGTFSDATQLQPMNVASSVTEGMGIDAADLDGDGNLDLYATGNQVTDQGGYVAGEWGSALLFGHGDGTFENRAVELGVNTVFSWGTGLVDFDNDGLVDIFVATDYADHHSVYRNLGGRQFTEIGVPGLYVHRNQCVAAAFADYDGDGRVDIALHRLDGTPPQLLHNESDSGNHYLQVRLHTGREELGARVQVAAGDLVLERELLGQTSHGSTNDRRFTFGLGAATSAVVTVFFPDGTTASASVLADQEVWMGRTGEVPIPPPGGCAFAASAPASPFASLLLLLLLLARRRPRITTVI
jgi:hypothetical protein